MSQLSLHSLLRRQLSLRWLGALLFVAGCTLGAEPSTGFDRLGAGEACGASTECGPGLRCIAGVCTEMSCRDYRDCPGRPSDRCAVWACVAAQCEPGCKTDVPDSGLHADADVARPDAGFPCDPVPRAPKDGDLVLNEFFADPHTDVMLGDANGDGNRSASEDEFIELGNTSTSTLELLGLQVADADRPRHQFRRYTLGCGEAVVVFGGGDDSHAGWRSNWIKSTSGGLSFNNGGDTIIVGTSTITPFIQYGFGTEAIVDQSLVRARELDDTAAFVEHTRHPDSNLARFSPGVRADGSEF